MLFRSHLFLKTYGITYNYKHNKLLSVVEFQTLQKDIYNSFCSDDLYNFYRENESLYGNTLATTDFDGFIDMSESIFDVYDCPDEEVTEVWVR